MTDAVPIPLTTTQVLAALAASLLPLAGEEGVAAAAVIPAAEQLIELFKAKPTGNYTIDDLAAIVAEGNAALAKLTVDVNALS